MSKKFLLVIALVTISGIVFSQEYIQTTFTKSGNEVVVYMKSSANISSAAFNYFQVDFRYVALHNPTFTVTNSSYTTVAIGQNEEDPYDSDYRIQRFGFFGGTVAAALTANVEYEVFRFTITDGMGVGPFGLVLDQPNYLFLPYYEIGNNDFTNWTDPFYGTLDNSDFSVNGEDWIWRTRDITYGKAWRNDAASSDWSTPSNWTDGVVPTGTDNITILDGANYPIAGWGSECNDIRFEGSSVEVAYNGSLTINGDILNLSNGGSLTVKSTALGTGSLIVYGNIPVGDEVTVERYIASASPSGDDGWHFLSSPVASQPIAPDFGGSAGQDFYAWDETDNGDLPWINFVGGTMVETDFVVGKGYLVSYQTGGTKEFTGTLNGSSILNIPLTNTDNGVPLAESSAGFNLLGNPFPSAILWGTGSWNPGTGVGANAQIWDEASADYVELLPGDAIPALNGFMVYTDSDSDIDIPLDARAHDATPWYKASGEERIVLVAHDTDNGTAKRSLVRFNSDATNAFDLAYDSYLLSGFGPVFYSNAGERRLSVNTLPELVSDLVVPFGFITNGSTNFYIQMEASVETENVLLVDRKMNVVHDLTANPVYAFTSQAGDDPSRFELKFGHVGVNTPNVNKPAFTVYTKDGSIYVNGNLAGHDIVVTNLTGQQLIKVAASEGMTVVNASNLTAGAYLISVVGNKAVATQKVILNR